MIDKEYKKIEEFAKVITGGTPSTKIKEYWDEGTIPWIQSGSCKGELVLYPDKYITQLGLEKSSARVMPINTILIALTGATTGKVGLLGIEACANQSVTGIIPNDNYNSIYLFYYLKSIRKQVLNDSYGGAQQHISQKYVKEILVPFPAIDIQNKIAEELFAIEEALKNKSQTIIDLDEIINSKFDEILSSEEVEKMFLKDIAIGKGEYGSGEPSIRIKSPEYRYIRITDILDNGELGDDIVTINNVGKNLKYKLEDYDFLFARTGATVGKTFLYQKKHGNCIYAGYLIKFKLNPKIINPNFLFSFTKTKSYKEWIKKYSTVVAQPNINAQRYGELLIPTPTMNVQNRFSEMVELIEKQKELIQQDIKDLELLLETKMHEHFA